jgi:hypothetical protein
VIRGRSDPEKISTSYVERFNLSTRMASRRFTRLTNGYSKKLENHRAAVALWVAFYNFCRVHETLRCTSGMALGVTDHIWTGRKRDKPAALAIRRIMLFRNFNAVRRTRSVGKLKEPLQA